MQYTQRMLQRSVTLIRRLLCTRPKESIRRSVVAIAAGSLSELSRWSTHSYSNPGPSRRAYPRMHPLFAAVGPDLLLPDGDHVLERVDQPLARLERVLAVGCADGHQHARLAQLEVAKPVHDGGLNDRPPLPRLGL